MKGKCEMIKLLKVRDAGCVLFWRCLAAGAVWASCYPATLQAGHAFSGLCGSAAAPFTALHHPVIEHPAPHQRLHARACLHLITVCTALHYETKIIYIVHTHTHTFPAQTHSKIW